MRDKLKFYLIKTVKKIREKFISNELVAIIGDHGINITYFRRDNLQQTFFIKYLDWASNQKLQEFLINHNYCNLRVVLAFSTINIQHESLPALQGLRSQNPIENYCHTYLHENDYYAYKVFSITQEPVDTWHSVVTWATHDDKLDKYFEEFFNAKLEITGVYLFPLLTKGICRLLANQYEINLQSSAYLIASETEVSGIHITIYHNDNILHSAICEYPLEKSAEYIQGIIEQRISDCWLRLKAYCTEKELKKINFLILSEKLYPLFKDQELGGNTTFVQSASNITKSTLSNEIGAESGLASLALQKLTGEATSKKLANYYNYTSFNKWFFKPITFGLLLLILFAHEITSKNKYLSKATQNLYSQYYKTSEEFRTLKSNFSNVNNLTQLADIYNLYTELAQPAVIPFKFLQDATELIIPDINLIRVTWNIAQDNTSKSEAEIKLSVIKNSTNLSPTQYAMQYMDRLKEKYPHLSFKILPLDEELSYKVINATGLKIIITGVENDPR